MLTISAKWLQESANLYRLAIFGLLVLAVSSVTIGIAALVQAVSANELWLLAQIALSLGWMLGGNLQKAWKSWLLIVSLGLLIPFLWVGQFWGLLWAWFGTLPGLLWQGLHRSAGVPINWVAFQTTATDLHLRLMALFADLGDWLLALAAGNPVFNYTATALGWGLALWFAASWAGWCQRRREQPLLAILPGSVLLLSVMGYTYGSTLALLVLLFTALLLAATTNYARKESTWKARGMDFPEARRGEIFSLFVGLALFFVLAAALLPRISIPAIIARMQAWANPHRTQIDPLLESLGLEAGSAEQGALAEAIQGGLPRQFLIGSGPELSEQSVMKVQIDDFQPADLAEWAIPLYWRSRTYDRYTGSGWQTSPVAMQFYAAGELAQEPAENYLQLQQSFEILAENSFIYATGEILSVDQDYQLAWRTAPEESPDFFAGIIRRPVYRVTTEIPTASEADLRATPRVYPAWITARYLPLPASLPSRVSALARELTRNAPTPYDKARALETYLRTYKYQLDLPAPPQNRDLVDTFLFELQKGYCDYYASALVVMARSIGIPARLAVGYTRGTYDSTDGKFIVTEKNAHTWAEIYFVGIGWVIFEPTAAQAEIDRAATGEESHLGTMPAPEGDVQDSTQRWDVTRGVRWLSAIALSGILLLGVWWILEAAYLRWLPPSKLAAHLFNRLYGYGPRLGAPPQRGETASEFATKLERLVTHIYEQSGRSKNLSELSIDLWKLRQFYLRAIFSSQPLTRVEKTELLHLWPGVRRQLRQAGWLFFWQIKTKKAWARSNPLPNKGSRE